MTTAIDAQQLADLLDDLMKWLQAHPNADIQDFADEHNCSVEDISDSWNTYFSADFSRDYKIDTDYDNDYHPAPPPHGDPQALKEYIVQEVKTYQSFTTINNIEDNSFNQQIIADDVHQDIDIDNSDNIADNGGVVVRDSELNDSNVNTGDRAVVDSDNSNVLTGDVSSSADDGSQAVNNINFGGGNTNQTSQDNSETTTTTTTDNSDNSDNRVDNTDNSDNSTNVDVEVEDSFNTETDTTTTTDTTTNTNSNNDVDTNTASGNNSSVDVI